MIDAVVFAVGLATMYAAHQIADHVLGQTDKMAENKAKPGKQGWFYIYGHVVNYHLVMTLMLGLTFTVLDLPATFLGVFLCLGFSAISHAFIDRRWPVKWILDHTGSPNFAKMTTPICGMYQGDQSLHYFCLWISALLLTL